MRRLLPLLLLLTLLAPGGAGQQARTDPGTAVAGPEALVLWSAGLDRLAPDGRDKGLRELVAALGADVRAGAGPRAGAALQLAARWIRQPLDLRAGLDGAGALELHLVVRFDDLDAARAESLHLRKVLRERGLPIETPGDDASRYAAATGAGRISVRAAAVPGGAAVAVGLGRAPDPSLEPLAGAGDEAACFGRIDGRVLGKGLEALVRQGGHEDGEELLELLRRLDLAGPEAPLRTFALRHGGDASSTTQVVRGWTRTHAGRRGAVPISRADLRIVPADAVWTWMGSVHPGSVLELARALDGAGARETLAGIEGATGVALETDLLAKLGPLAGGYARRNPSGLPLATLVLFARSPDPAAASGALQKLLASIPVPGGDARELLDTWRHRGAACVSLTLPGFPLPVEPSWGARSGWVILATNRDSLRQALDQLDAETSLVDRHGRLAEPIDQGLVGLGLLDASACLPIGYGLASSMLAELPSARRGLPDLNKLLPPAIHLSRGLRPSLSLTRLEGEDLVTVTTHDASWIARATASLGSPGVGGPVSLSLAASIALPKLMAARLAANERAAVATLRSLASAQAQCWEAAAIDADGDGTGEYGLLSELAATRPARGSDRPVATPFLPPAMGTLRPDGRGGALVMRNGYCFQVWLPGARGGPVCDPIAEPGGEVFADAAEVEWCAYAWPIEAGQTGLRCFYIDQEGDLLVLPNIGARFSGLDRAPRGSAGSLAKGGWVALR